MVVSRSLGLLCLAISAIPSARAAGNGPVKFNRDIRPIMSDTCFRCHGPDKRSRMAGMRLDLREEALKPRKSGLAPIAPSDPDRSAIIQRIFAADPRKIMPPQNVHKELTAAQKETVRRWVAEGASYEGHWAYQPVKRPLVPEVAPASRNPIDAFIRERLAAEKLHPSPEADRRTLLRRVTLDLTGIPPTGEEYDTFRQDTAPDAYDKVVNRLLDSPRYAEMRSMLWLDAVRYGDSSGFHGDNLWPVWPYRDYVLRAFRDNMPFDRFTREQIAGDLLPDGAIDQKVASAYNRLNRASAEGGIQFKEYLAKYGADRVRTTSTTWLGSTMGCAECHDHKFDPFSSRDFYAMKAFFADIKETGLIPDRGPKAWGSKLYLPTAEQKAKLEELTRAVETGRAALKERVEQLRDERLLWEERILAAHAAGRLAWRYQRPLTAQAANGAKLTIYNEEPLDFNFYLNGSLASERKPGGGLIAASGPNPDNETYTVTMKPGAGSWTGLGIEIQQDESLPGTRLGRGADRFVLSEVEALLTEASGAVKPLPMVLANTTGFGEPGDMPPLNAIDGNPKTGWAVSFGEHRNAFLAVRFGGRVATAEGSTLTVKLRQDSDYRRATIGRFRIALSAGEYSWPETGDSGSKRKAAPNAERCGRPRRATGRTPSARN
ncbi:MAG: DUF1549 domain-containing protein [Acidobacteria bacterium]|nr:DUF1549 domain-containing protein [Acidobacteriota bacterium]